MTAKRNKPKPTKTAKLAAAKFAAAAAAARVRDPDLLEVRATEVACLFARRFTKGEVKQFLYDQYRIGYRSAETIITHAKRILIGWRAKDLDEAYDQAVDFFNSKIRTSRHDKDQIRAQEKLCEIQGIGDPKSKELTQQLLTELAELKKQNSELLRLQSEIRTGKPATEDGGPLPADNKQTD